MTYGEKPARKHVQPESLPLKYNATVVFRPIISNLGKKDEIKLPDSTLEVKVAFRDSLGFRPSLVIYFRPLPKALFMKEENEIALFLSAANSGICNVEPILEVMASSSVSETTDGEGQAAEVKKMSLDITYTAAVILGQKLFTHDAKVLENPVLRNLANVLRTSSFIKVDFGVASTSLQAAWTLLKTSLAQAKPIFHQWFGPDGPDLQYRHSNYRGHHSYKSCLLTIEEQPRKVLLDHITFPDILSYCYKMFVGIAHEIETKNRRRDAREVQVRLIQLSGKHHEYFAIVSSTSDFDLIKDDECALWVGIKRSSVTVRAVVLASSKFSRAIGGHTLHIKLSDPSNRSATDIDWMTDNSLASQQLRGLEEKAFKAHLLSYPEVECCMAIVNLSTANEESQMEILQELAALYKDDSQDARNASWKLQALLANDLVNLPGVDLYAEVLETRDGVEARLFIQNALDQFKATNQITEFDPDQQELFDRLRVLDSPLCFVDGFPGAGKSVALRASLAPLLANATSEKPARIVVACASNSAADDLAVALLQDAHALCQDTDHMPLVVRLYSPYHEAMAFQKSNETTGPKYSSRIKKPELSAASHMFCLATGRLPVPDPQEQKIKIDPRWAFHRKALGEVTDQWLFLSHEHSHNVHRYNQELLAALLRRADVVCCTTAVLTRVEVRRNLDSTVAVIDECIKVQEPELLPLFTDFKSLRCIIGFGSSRQLSIMVPSDSSPLMIEHHAGEEAKQTENPVSEQLSLSLHERWMSAGCLTLPLRYTRRFESTVFGLMQVFEPGLKAIQFNTTETVSQVANFLQNHIFDSDFRSNICMIGHQGLSEAPNKSQINVRSARLVIYLVDKLIREGFSTTDIGIVAPYIAQSGLIKEELLALQENLSTDSNVAVRHRAKSLWQLSVNTVDGMQGQERELIIFDFVTHEHVSFLGFPRRMTVGCSRARTGLIMIANVGKLQSNVRDGMEGGYRDLLFSEVIGYCLRNKLFKEAKDEWALDLESEEFHSAMTVLKTRSNSEHNKRGGYRKHHSHTKKLLR